MKHKDLMRSSNARSHWMINSFKCDKRSFLLSASVDKYGDTKETKLYHYNLEGGTSTWNVRTDLQEILQCMSCQIRDVEKRSRFRFQTDRSRWRQSKNSLRNRDWRKKCRQPIQLTSVRRHQWKIRDSTNSTTKWMQTFGADSNDAVKVTKSMDRRSSVWQSKARQKTRFAVSTKLTGLKAGKDYVAEVYVDNRSDSKAARASNAGTFKSLHLYDENQSLRTMWQVIRNMQAAMKLPICREFTFRLQRKKETATLTISRAAGDEQHTLTISELSTRRLKTIKKAVLSSRILNR